MATPTQFQYFFNKRTTLLIVSWTGELTVRDVEALEKCAVEVRTSAQKYIIVNLHGFTGYDAVLAGNIVNFQNMIRSKAHYMLLAGLDDKVKLKLLEKGLAKDSEITADLKEALQRMLKLCPP